MSFSRRRDNVKNAITRKVIVRKPVRKCAVKERPITQSVFHTADEMTHIVQHSLCSSSPSWIDAVAGRLWYSFFQHLVFLF